MLCIDLNYNKSRKDGILEPKKNNRGEPDLKFEGSMAIFFSISVSQFRYPSKVMKSMPTNIKTVPNPR